MSFDENQHNRSSDGKFAEKVGTEPDDGFGAMLAETLRTIRERDQREAEDDAAGPRVVRDQFGNFPPGFTIADLIIDEDDDDDNDEFDASRKFSSMRSYPGMNGIPMTAVDAPKKFCVECGDEVSVGDEGVTHHVTEDGDIDHDKDAEHTAIDDSEYGDETPVLFVTDDGYEVRPADDQDAYAVYDESGTYITTVTSVSDDHLSIEDELREKLAELKAADGR